MYQIQSQTPYMLRATFQTIRTKYIAILPVTSDLCDKSSPPPGPGHTDLIGTPDDIYRGGRGRMECHDKIPNDFNQECR